VGTYASINPIVAILLGWALGGETITPRALIAGAIVVLGVALTLRARARSGAPALPPVATKEPA
jgi:drug/metabolite transporter (DMT)-like permease